MKTYTRHDRSSHHGNCCYGQSLADVNGGRVSNRLTVFDTLYSGKFVALQAAYTSRCYRHTVDPMNASTWWAMGTIKVDPWSEVLV